MLRIMEKNLLEQRIKQLEIVSALSAQIIVDTAQTKVSNVLQRLDKHYLGVRWWWYGAGGDLRDSSLSGENQSLPPEPRQIFQVQASSRSQQYVVFPSILTSFSKQKDFVRFILPLKIKKQSTGVLVFDYSLQNVREKLVGLQKLVLIYVFVYGLVLVAAGYFLLERNIIRPARALLKATESVRSGDLNTRLPEFGPTEITNLSASYNQMVEALAASRQETERYIKSLEATNQELKQARGQLIQSEKMASVGELAAGLAHELGNPLAALIGYLELLKTQVTISQHGDILQRSLTEAERIDFLVRELLNFSRPVEELFPEKINLNAELDYCVKLLQHQGSMYQVSVSRRFSEPLPEVFSSRERLRQVFINMLLNAVQACDSSGHIILSSEVREQKVFIGIEDNGCGLPEGLQKKIFEPFFTTKAPGKGTGLGLSICQRIISEEGGTISVRSTPDNGCFFTVELPFVS